jgi:rhodanese-related sulfurtransferase
MAAAWETISPETLAALRQQRSVHLIDVRTPTEFQRLHVEGARNIPLDQLDAAKLPNDEEPVYVMCRRGTRSELACEQLLTAGVKRRVVHVSGGVLAWYDAELPVVFGRAKRRRFTPQRVLIASLMLGSILAALVVHKGFMGITGYVAAYLVAATIREQYRFMKHEKRRAEEDLVQSSAND